MEIVTADETLIARILPTKIRFNLRRNNLESEQNKKYLILFFNLSIFIIEKVLQVTITLYKIITSFFKDRI